MITRAVSRGHMGMEESSYSNDRSQASHLPNTDWNRSVIRNGATNGIDDAKLNFQLETAIRFAKEESLRLGHKFVGSEQLLVGILRQDRRVAAMVLNSLGVSTDKVRREIKNIVGYGAAMGEVTEEDLHSTLLFRRVIEAAMDISRRFRCEDVRTEHLLLAIIASEKGVALRVLETLNVDLRRLLFLINEVDK